MKKLYLDTNIFLNVLFQEDGFFETSYRLLQSIEAGKYEGMTSLLTFMEIHRVLQKQKKSEEHIKKALHRIRETPLNVVIPTEVEIISAYEMVQKFKLDPMDAMHVAIYAEAADGFVTRDEKVLKVIGAHFDAGTPEDFLDR